MLTIRQYTLMRELWQEGATMKEIASKVGCSVSAVGNAAFHNRGDFPRRNHKVTKEDERKISLMHAQGASIYRIAKAIGCNRQTVARRLKKEGL